jgi:hypothetical protein
VVLANVAADKACSAADAVHAVTDARLLLLLLLPSLLFRLLPIPLQLLKLAQLQLQYMQYKLEEKVGAEQALEDDSLAIAGAHCHSHC